ncbi:hypothetical protein [Escherichia coli]
MFRSPVSHYRMRAEFRICTMAMTCITSFRSTNQKPHPRG